MSDFLWTRPDGPGIGTVLLTHGSGAPMDSPFMERMTAALAAEGLHVARFEFAYMARRRVDAKKRLPPSAEKLVAEYIWAIRRLYETPDLVQPVILSGKSLGGRVAVMAAGPQTPGSEPLPPVAGVACLGYPFHPTGEPDKLRLGPLNDCTLPLLIVQGDRDDFGSRAEVEDMQLPAEMKIVWLDDGSHDFGPRGQSGATLTGNIAAAAAAVAHMARELAPTILTTDPA